jgi:SAM-dependent methyltransferase
VSTAEAAPSAEPERRWGEGSVDPHEWTLPALKARYVLDALPRDRSPLRVLDYGCGEGKLLLTIRDARPDAVLVGTDVQVPKRTDGFSYHGLDDARLGAQPFDVVCSLDVLEHVPDLESSLRHIRSLLAPRGVFIGFVPMEGEAVSPYRFWRALLGADLYARTKDHQQAYARRAFLERLRSHFDLVDVSYAYHLLGSMLDSTFFAACAHPAVARWWWNSNAIYRPETQAKKSLANRAMLMANAACYLESRLLRHVPLLASGLLVTGAPRG